MKQQVALEITADGGVQMLHDDAVDLSQFGEIEVSRASHVEYSDGLHFVDVEGYSINVPAKGWFVMSAASREVLASGFKTRAEALAWEKQHYGPGGAGWSELTEDA